MIPDIPLHVDRFVLNGHRGGPVVRRGGAPVCYVRPRPGRPVLEAIERGQDNQYGCSQIADEVSFEARECVLQVGLGGCSAASLRNLRAGQDDGSEHEAYAPCRRVTKPSTCPLHAPIVR